jgi:large subunit ribosomal protein L13
MVLVLDASNLILGRLASESAKLIKGKPVTITGTNSEGKSVTAGLKEGDRLVIVNADKAVITGNPLWTTKRYLQRMKIKVNTNPRRGPFFPRQPEDIVRRAIRGMVKNKTPSGRAAYKRVHVFAGMPTEEYKKQAIRIDQISADHMLCKRITVGELGKRISTFTQRKSYVEKNSL